jgi:hypothetical protein
MSLSKSKCLYLNKCLQFLKRAVPSLKIIKNLFLKIPACSHQNDQGPMS